MNILARIFAPLDFGPSVPEHREESRKRANSIYREQLLQQEIDHQWEICLLSTDPEERQRASIECERLRKELCGGSGG